MTESSRRRGPRLLRMAAIGIAIGVVVVVVQDQSQVPGFGANDDDFLKSQDALDDLGTAATAAHAHVVLFQTWGHEDGDARNRGIYPTFEEMQSRLTNGYDRYLQSLRDGPAADAEVSQVGKAWARVQAADSAVFASLYRADGSHPSKAGTYLAALVLAQTISHHGLPAATWSPDYLTAHQAQIIQVAARTA